MIDVDRAIDVLGAIADHRATIWLCWLSPAIVVLFVPEKYVLAAMVVLMGVFTVFQQAQLNRDTRVLLNGDGDE